MSANGKMENGVNNSYSSIAPSAESDERPSSVPKSPNESWCHVESSDQSPEMRSQRRHYKDFNRSSVFDFVQSPPPPPPEEIKEDDPEQANQKHKQKRHFENKNQSSLDL